MRCTSYSAQLDILPQSPPPLSKDCFNMMGIQSMVRYNSTHPTSLIIQCLSGFLLLLLVEDRITLRDRRVRVQTLHYTDITQRILFQHLLNSLLPTSVKEWNK